MSRRIPSAEAENQDFRPSPSGTSKRRASEARALRQADDAHRREAIPDRASAASMKANQLRLWFASMAYLPARLHGDGSLRWQ
jgi:hypothetical protein